MPAEAGEVEEDFGGGGHGGFGGGGFGGGGYGGYGGHSFGGYGGGHISSYGGFNGGGRIGNFNGAENFGGRINNGFVGHDEAWNAGHAWDRGYWNGDQFGRYGYGNRFNRFYGYGGFGLWPWYDFVWWPGYYDYYGGYPYYGDYYGYDAYPSVDYGQYANAGSPEATPYAAAEPSISTNESATNEELPESEYYTEALTAFKGGDYTNAIRLASHAMIDQPRNQDVHLLLMLGFFAMGQYRPAAMEAHAVASLGKMPDWPTVYAVYGDVDTYTKQLRAWSSPRSRTRPTWRAVFCWASNTRSTATRGRPRPSSWRPCRPCRRIRWRPGC